MIEVMWIDDEWEDKGVPFIMSADNEGINIAPYDTYAKGIAALERDPQRWVAVILDVREQAAEQGTATDNFHMAREKIKEFQLLNHQKEPYVFVLTGEANYLDSDAFPKMNYASKRVYSKGLEDCKILFDDIKRIAELSLINQITHEYNDVLSAAKDYFKVDSNTYVRLFKLIQKIIYQRVVNNQKLLNEIRKILEIMIVPQLKNLSYIPNDLTALNTISKKIDEEERCPEYIQRSFHSIVNITQEGSHGKTIDADVSKGQAPYLLRSCLYELLNIIIWMKEQK